jgi:hypothetical protein
MKKRERPRTMYAFELFACTWGKMLDHASGIFWVCFLENG